jgi:hypothetical protein
MKIVIVLFLFLTVCGCGIVGSGEGFRTDRYQLVASSDGKVYRLDKKTGEVSTIDGNSIRSIGNSDQTNLVVGMFYKTEEGKLMRYAGKGNFEPSMTAEEFLKKHKDPLGIR